MNKGLLKPGGPRSKLPGYFSSNLLPNQIPMTDQSKNPLHGITLEKILLQLVEHYGWEELGNHVPIRCFTENPSLKSSLTFLRKTPWARKKIELLFLETKQPLP